MTIQIEYIIYFCVGMLAGILLEFALALAVGWRFNK